MPESRVGRPRSESARQAVLQAVRALTLAHGFDSVTMSQIALTAGVGRQTIYRWWRSKEALVADAVLDEALPLDTDLIAGSGDVGADLRRWIEASMARMDDSNSAALYRALLAASAVDSDAAARMNAMFAEPLRNALRAAYEADGRAEQADVIADVMIGAFTNALVTRDPAARLRLTDVVDLVVRGTDQTSSV